MKILGRIVYAFIAVILFLYVMNLSESIMTTKFFEKYGAEHAALKDDEFFYGGAGFHTKKAIFQYEDAGLHIRFYEVTKLFIQEKTQHKKVEEYVYILLYDDNKTIKPSSEEEYYLSFYNEVNDHHYDISIRRFRDLEVFVGVYLDRNEMKSLLPKESFFEYELSKLSILHENQTGKETILSVPFALSEDDFTIGNILLNEYENRHQLGVYDRSEHSIAEFRSVLYLAIGIYAGMLILTTYFIYFFNFNKFREKLSKRKAIKMYKKER